MTIGDCGFAGASLSFAWRIGASAIIAPMQIATGECLMPIVWHRGIFSSISDGAAPYLEVMRYLRTPFTLRKNGNIAGHDLAMQR
jgi:hypothetical protein